MCDESMLEQNAAYLRQREVSRRQFGALSVGAGLVATLPRAANAQDVTETEVEIETPDGTADCYFVHPSSGSYAAVLVWPDILGLRTSFRQMGRRLAESGYSVLVVNPFYRNARAPVVAEGASFQDESVRNTVFPLAQSLSAQTHVTDATAFINWLDEQAAVDSSRGVGTTGYCMGGPMVMRTVAARADRVRAGATFHGGGLVTEADNSPHLLIPQMNASLLHAVAANDDESDPEAKNVLRESYSDAGLSAEIEVYEGALHGWCPPDSAVYNEPQAERAWSRLLVLFESALA